MLARDGVTFRSARGGFQLADPGAAERIGPARLAPIEAVLGGASA